MNEQSMDIGAVAKATGLTSRTLRHYDDIGLLTPAWTGHDGRRHYAQPELLRLQHILVLKRLGVALDTIARIVETDDDAETLSVMRQHLGGLEAESARYARLAATVRHTIDSLEKGKTMTNNEILDGFDHERYAPEAREMYGEEEVDATVAVWDSLGEEGQLANTLEHAEIAAALAEHMKAGVDIESAEVQELAARHHAWVSTFWTPDADAYRGLADGYVADARFKTTYDKFGDGLAEYLRSAIHAFAARM